MDFNKNLKPEYDSIELQETLFLTLIYYDIEEALDYYFDKFQLDDEINKCIEICIERDNLNKSYKLDDNYKRDDLKLLDLIVKQNGIQILDYLIKNGANINALNNMALRLTLSNGNLEVVKFLIENGANIHF